MADSFPVFEYCLAGIDDALCPTDKLWRLSLIGKSNDFASKTLSSASSLTIGDYLLSARKFLENNGYLFLRKGLKVVLSHNIEVHEIGKIKISLEKHGPFYHPIKVIAFLKNEEPVFFVLNGAVSEMGLVLIENEYQNLEQLNPGLNPGQLNSKVFIPEVFGMGFVETEKGKVGFFLAEWFDNFEEFHVVRTDNKNKTGILKKTRVVFPYT